MADFDQITRIGGDYWEKRALKQEQLTQDRASDTVRAVCDSYDRAQAEIVARIEEIYSRYVNNNEALNEEKALRLLSEKQTAEYRQKLLELYRSTDDPQLREEIRARLDAPAYANRISRLQALRDSLYLDCRMLGLDEVRLVRDRLMDVLEQSFYRQVFDIQQGVGLYYDFSRLSNRQMQAVIAQPWNRANYSSRIWKNNKAFAENVERTVATGILSGQSYRDMADNLRRVVGEDDGEGAKYKSMRLIRTECSHVATQGQMLGYQSAGIEKYIFLATLDLVTSQICRSLDMKRFPTAEAETGVNLPPMHPNCRSTTMPDVDEEVLAKIKRFARDPVTGKSTTVPGTISYREWYEKYVQGNPEAEANEKKKRNRAADRRQFERYKTVLGDEAPKSLVDFQRMKYESPEEWAKLKRVYREANRNKKTVDNPVDSGIINVSEAGGKMDQSIEIPIEYRSSGKGNPNAIIQIGYPLNTRQQRLLNALPGYDSRFNFKKSDVSMKDLAALTAETGDEFAMFTRNGRRLVIRGNPAKVNITVEDATQLSKDGYRWSGHTHPGLDELTLIPSEGDKMVLREFAQECSCIYNSKGQYYVFGKE